MIYIIKKAYCFYGFLEFNKINSNKYIKKRVVEPYNFLNKIY